MSARISGLTGNGLALRLNGGLPVEVGADGRIDFQRGLMPGAPYEITVAEQPTEPAQVCTVMNGVGVVGEEPIEIAVACTTSSFAVGGAVSGLAGSGLVLENNGTDPTSVDANGSFAFARALDSGVGFDVTVATQPRDPVQTCTVSGGRGVIGGGPVSSIVVDCATDRFAVGGIITGLEGSVVVRNGDEEITLTANGSFAFPSTVESGATYALSVVTQPVTPSQTCTVTDGAGRVDDADITTPRIACTTNTFSVRGTVSGLAGDGLVLQVNGGSNLPITDDGTFAFPAPIASGQPYAVTVLAQPSTPTQVCTLAQATGTIGGADVTDVAVTCTTTTFPVRTTVHGLAGAGLVLRNNGSDDLAVQANGATEFATPVASGQPYAVTVRSQPTQPSQTCVVSAGTGTVGAGPVESTVVNCTTDRFTLGGTVRGLAGTLVLRNNGGDDLTVSANGTFAFPSTIASGDAYAVTVAAQPGQPSQTCTVTHGSGAVTSANVTGVEIDCTTNTFHVSATVTGLDGQGLILANNQQDVYAAGSSTGGAPFTFTFPAPIPSGASYDVSVVSHPSQRTQTCTVVDGAGVIGAANVANVRIECTTRTFPVGGTVTGLGTSSLYLELAGEPFEIDANGTFSLPHPVASGDSYQVAIASQPAHPFQTCTLTNGTGTVTDAAVTNIAIACTTNRLAIGGTVTGLAETTSTMSAPTLVLTNNGGDSLTIAGNGPFTFPQAVESGKPFVVAVAQQPAYPNQTCTVTGGSGVVGGDAVTTVSVNCTTNTFTVSGNVYGLAGQGLVLANGTDTPTITSNGEFAFATPVASGHAYDVTVIQQPTNPAQICKVTAGSGVIAAANVTDVVVECKTERYAIGGTVTGMEGTSFVIRNNTEQHRIDANGPFEFPTALATGTPYSVMALTRPENPWQSCAITRGAGTVGTSAVTDIEIVCTRDNLPVAVTVSGLLPGNTVKVQNNGDDSLVVTQDGFFFFAKRVLSGHPYSVVIEQQPAGQICSLSDATGTMTYTTANVTVTCEAPVCGGLGEGCCQDSSCDAGLACTSGTCTEPMTECPPGYYWDPFAAMCMPDMPMCPPDMYWDPMFGCMPMYEPPPMCGMPGFPCCGEWCEAGYTCSSSGTCEYDAGGIPGG